MRCGVKTLVNGLVNVLLAIGAFLVITVSMPFFLVGIIIAELERVGADIREGLK